jgi:2-polyprenyl-3-methyl-5-hydroxy-6-metoxy-1,4-benzoquinol methylase
MEWEHSRIGPETLRRVRALERYNEWIVREIRPWAGRRVLEVGSGIGTFSRFFLESDLLVLSDIREEYLRRLRETYGGRANVAVENYNLEESSAHLAGRGIDTVIALNVLEHIRDDSHALSEIAAVLSPGGRIILQLPAHRLLYGSLDVNLDHYRRYTARDIRAKLAAAGFETEIVRRFNMFGAAGWFVASRILKRPILPEGQLGLFNLLTPLFMAIERLIPVPFGLSLLVVGKKR